MVEERHAVNVNHFFSGFGLFRALSLALLVLGTLFVLLFSHNARASIEVNLNVEYFNLKADTPDDLLRALKKANLGESTDIWSRIDWKLLGAVNFKSTTQGCKLRQLNSEVDVVMTLPQWINVNELPQQYQDWWQTFQSYVTTHEHHHKNHIIEAISAAVQEYTAIGELDSCSSVRNEYFRIKQKYAAEIKQKDQALDAKDGADVCLEALMMGEADTNIQLAVQNEPKSSNNEASLSHRKNR